jgi:GTP-binding protein HflX
MFATLDPTLRLLRLPSRRRVLLSDTVGFIRALPPSLVKAFRATLEEVQGADLLLHVMDSSAPSLAMHCEEVEKVLRELKVDDRPCIYVANKADLLPAQAAMPALPRKDAVLVSAREKTGLDTLLEEIDRALTADPLEERAMLVPQSEGAVLAAFNAGAVVVERRFEEDQVFLRVRGPASLLNRYRRFWTKREAPESIVDPSA